MSGEQPSGAKFAGSTYRKAAPRNSASAPAATPPTGGSAQAPNVSSASPNNDSVMRFFKGPPAVAPMPLMQQSPAVAPSSSYVPAPRGSGRGGAYPQQQSASYQNRGRGGSGGGGHRHQDPIAALPAASRPGGGYPQWPRGGGYQQQPQPQPQYQVAASPTTPAGGRGASGNSPVPSGPLEEGSRLNRNSRRDYDAIVRAFAVDEDMTELEFPSTLTAEERQHVHMLATHFNLAHKSSGPKNARVLKLTKEGGSSASPHGHPVPSSSSSSNPTAAAASSTTSRRKTIEGYQGAQLLKDEYFAEVHQDVWTAVAPLHRAAVNSIRREATAPPRPPKVFRAPQPGLNAVPKPQRAIDAKRLAELTAFREKLPSYKQKRNIVQAVQDHRVVIVCGDTGCGKTTQVPQMLWDSGILSRNEQIYCTQPRRISALSVAQRVAEERGQACGHDVGYIIRFENVTSDATHIVYCTTGILLRRLHGDPDLKGISCVVVDEVHERDLDTDFVLLLLRDLLRRNPQRNLKVVVMSATIQIERLVGYFFKANGSVDPPLIDIPGTLFPVEEYFLEDALRWTGIPASTVPAMELANSVVEATPMESAEPTTAADATAYSRLKQSALQQQSFKDEEAMVPYALVVKLIEGYDERQGRDKSGSVLVFVPGWGQIDRLATMLRRSASKFSVLMLHSSINSAEQARVFDPPPRGFRKVVLSTNIAETSITIDDVTFVIDSCLLKGTAYDVAGNTSSLQSQWIAKANGRQRRGRAGRCRPGTCIHLLPRAAYERLPDFLPPEMLRSSLEEVCLQVKAVKPNERCMDVLDSALDAPPINAVQHAVTFLKQLGAFDPRENVTSLGRALAQLPVHPLLGKMLFVASCLGVLEPISIIAAGLSSKSPFLKPFPHQLQDMQNIRESLDGGNLSDHLVVLNLYRQWKAAPNRQDFAMRHLADNSTLYGMDRSSQQLMRLVLQSPFVKRLQRPSNNNNNNNVSAAAWYCSRHASNTGLIRLTLLWSLLPKVLVMEVHRVRRRLEGYCWDNKPATMHRSSVLSKKHRSDFVGREFAAYFDRMRVEAQLNVFDATVVSHLSFLLCTSQITAQPLGSVSAEQWLVDDDSKYGPFDGHFDPRRALGLRAAAEGTAAADAATTTTSSADQASSVGQQLDVSAFQALIVDNDGKKVFLVRNSEATTLLALRECLDFYFSLAMRDVSAASFPQELVVAVGRTIGYPVTYEAQPNNAPRSGAAGGRPQEEEAQDGGAETFNSQTAPQWARRGHSDSSSDDEDNDRDASAVQPEMTLVSVGTLSEAELNKVYGEFGDLSLIRRALFLNQNHLDGERRAAVGSNNSDAPPGAVSDAPPVAVKDEETPPPPLNEASPPAPCQAPTVAEDASDDDDDVVVAQW